MMAAATWCNRRVVRYLLEYGADLNTQRKTASVKLDTTAGAAYAQPMQELTSLPRRARLFRNGSNQAVRIPREYEFPTDEVVLYKDGDRLIIEPSRAPSGLLRLLKQLEPIDDVFPDVDEDLQSLDDVKL